MRIPPKEESIELRKEAEIPKDVLDSFNVSSITDNGTGDVTVTYTVAMGQADYVAFGTVTHSSKGVVSITDQTALLVQAITREANTATMTDYGKVSVIAFGDS